MKKFSTKIIGITVAATMLFASGTAFADVVQPSQEEQAVQGQTMADYDAYVAINTAGQTTNSTFYFTPLYDGEYAFSIVDPQFSTASMTPVVRVGERPMSSTMTLQAGRTYQITASVTSAKHELSHTEYYWSWWGWTPYKVIDGYTYDEGDGVYGISIRFNAPEIEPEVSETVVVEVEDWRYDTQAREWTEVYTENSYQFTPAESGEYQVAIGDVESAWQWSDGWHLEGWSIVPNEPGEMTPAVSIYNGEDLIFYLEGEGADVTKLDADVTYLVIATADHTGTYTLTIAPAPAVEIHYTEEQLRVMSTSNFVGTLYSRILGRFSDAQGRAEFTDELLNQGYTATQIATIMFTSEEFGNLAMDDATFIATAYYTFCDREATADEAAALMAGLADGSTTRAQIIEQLAASDEWASFCAFYGVNV